MQSLSIWSKLSSLAVIAFVGLAGCSSVQRENYPANADPRAEINKLENDIDTALGDQYDVVAPKELAQSQEYLDKAKAQLDKQGKLSSIWEDIGDSRGYLNRAKDIYAQRHQKVTDVLKARQAALDAGARNSARAEKELTALDDSFRANSGALDRVRDNRIWDRTRVNYEALELIAIQEANIGDARTMVIGAKRKGARFYSPKTLKDAENAIAAADKAIALHPHDQTAYSASVATANRAARDLVAVNTEARRAAGQTNEEVAREIVGQGKAMGSLKSELKGAEAESEMKGQALVDKESQLRGVASSEAALARDKKFNDKLAEARKEFATSEADVYRDGDNLLIRLKKINFETGKADIPSQSVSLLAKVKDVIKDLNASAVVVQGHTDATGSPQVNKTLSKERADAVAKYLESDVQDGNIKAVGYGYEKPLSSNKTKTGRAANRRVDIVITPAAM